MRLDEAAEFLKCRFVGSPEHLILGLNEIHRVEPGDLCFVDFHKYYDKALNSAATTILIDREVSPPAGKGLLISDDPFRDFNLLSNHFHPPLPQDAAQDLDFPDAVLGQNVVIGVGSTLGVGVQIGHNSVIGSHVHIDDYTIIHANVTIYSYTTIGKHCTINAGAVIGGEAFYYKKRPDRKDKMLSVGRTALGDWVDVGAGSTIDRGVTAVTSIGDHTKIDNQVQIGHDTIIGKRCLVAASAAIAGAVTLEDDVSVWGQAGIVQDLTIGKGANILGKTGVMSSLEGGKTYGGFVADGARSFLRKEAAIRKLPDLLPKLIALLKAYEDPNQDI
ncbi:UNVERIFIED_CONTAM: hypothetical protein GTU68_057494 [Idotea baltica]|nr:hypothetical protein [Idotea baltica]